MRRLLLFLILSLAASSALAQPYTYKKKTIYEFEKDQVEGEKPKPKAHKDPEYQEAWKLFLNGKGDEALTKMTAVLQSKGAPEKDALQDLALFYAWSKDQKGAKSFFAKAAGEKNLVAALVAVGQAYLSKGDFQASLDIFQELLSLDPKSDDSYLYQYQICLATYALSFYSSDATLTETKKLLALSQEMAARKAPPERLSDAKSLAEPLLKEIALRWHATGQKTRSQPYYVWAEGAYEVYLKSFPEAKDGYTMTWNYAELLFQLASNGDKSKWEKAAEVYLQVVDKDPNGKHYNEAILAAVISYQNEASTFPKMVPLLDPNAKPQPIPEPEQKRLKAYQLYVEKAPNKEKTDVCFFEIGYIYYQHNHLDEAMKSFELLLDKHNQSSFSIYAANYLLDIYILQKKYDALRTLTLQILKEKSLFSDEALQERASAIHMKLQSDQCQRFYSDQLWGKAVECYDSLAKEFPAHPDMMKIKYNQSLAAENAKMIDLAISLRKELINDSTFAKTQEASRSLFAVARLYMNIGSYPEAADYFEQFATQYPGEPDASAALNLAAVFREALGEYEKAAEDKKKYLLLASRQKIPKAEIAGAFYQIAQIRDREGDIKKAKAAYEQYTQTYAKEGTTEQLLVAKTKLASYEWQEKRKEEARTRCQEVIKIAEDYIDKAPDKSRVAEQLGLGLDAAAECQFYLAEKGFEAFLALKLPKSFEMKKLEEWLINIKRIREKTSEEYMKIVSYGSKGWSLAAFARIGLMSYQFAELLLKAPLPTEVEVDLNGDGVPEKVKLKGELKAEAEKIVRDQLTAVAAPIQNDALTAFKICVEGAIESNWYNEWSSLCEDHLIKLDPNTYHALTEWTSEPTYDAPVIVAPSPVIRLR